MYQTEFVELKDGYNSIIAKVNCRCRPLDPRLCDKSPTYWNKEKDGLTDEYPVIPSNLEILSINFLTPEYQAVAFTLDYTHWQQLETFLRELKLRKFDVPYKDYQKADR